MNNANVWAITSKDARVFLRKGALIFSTFIFDVRTAQQLALLVIIPFTVIYLMIELGDLSIDVDSLLIIAGIVGLIDFILYFIIRIIFEREEILTKWK